MKQWSLIFIEIAILAVLFSSCSNMGDKKKQKPGNHIELEDKQENLISRETRKVKGNKLHPKFKVKEYCNREDQDLVMFYLGKFGKKTAFYISIKQTNKSLQVKYQIIDDCCLKFSAKARLDSTKLNLFHLNRTGDPCECFCMYEFEFLLKDMDVPDKLLINKEEVEI